MPTLSALLTSFASKLTDIENYETEDGKFLVTWVIKANLDSL
jgi:hypothetical protein